MENLTPEQKAMLPEYRQKWIDIGLSTEPLDFERAKEAATRAYIAAGEKPPKEWAVFDSPLACARAMAMRQYNTKNPTKEQIEEHVKAQVYGCHDAVWLSFYDFFKDVGIEECKQLQPLMDLAKYCGWWAPYDEICCLQHRPVAVRLDDQQRLHGEGQPAIEYRDGFGAYVWHGTRVPKEWVMDPKNSLTPEIALYWENTEQRRAACEIMGWDNIIKMLNPKVIDKNTNPQIGTLLEVEHENIGRERFLRVQCGTGRTFAIPVPPEVQTAAEANAWTYNIAANDIYDIEVRT